MLNPDSGSGNNGNRMPSELRFLLVKRIAALAIDFLLALGIFVLLYNGLLHYLDRIKSDLIFDISQIVGGFFVFFWLTLALQEILPWRATVGKLLLTLRVKSPDGNRSGFFRVLFRNLLKLLSVLTAGVGFLVLQFRKDRRTLHDVLSGTRVQGKSASEHAAERRKKEEKRADAEAKKLAKRKPEKPAAETSLKFLLVKRGLAFLIDFLAASGLAVFLYFRFLAFLDKIKSDLILDISQYAMIYAAILFLYFVLFEASPLRATIGKMIFSVRVFRRDDRKLTFLRVLLRNLFKFLTVATAGAGYAVALFRKDRRTLHDLLSGTRAMCVPRPDKETMKRTLDHYRPLILTFSFIVIGVFAVWLLASGFLVKAGPRMSLRMRTSTNDIYELSYDLGNDTGYESATANASVEPSRGFRNVVFPLPGGKTVHQVRIDFGNSPAEMAIKSIRMEGLTCRYIWTPAQITNLLITNEFITEFRLKTNVIRIVSAGTDPYVVLKEDIYRKYLKIQENDRTWRAIFGAVYFILIGLYAVSRPKSKDLATILSTPLFPAFALLVLNYFVLYRLALYLPLFVLLLIFMLTIQSNQKKGPKEES
jgi:uncharacterized RDD family membrane protein YckC